MKKHKNAELEPMPRYMKAVLAVLAIIFAAFVFLAGRYYLPNWKGGVIFLPVALLIGLLLIAAVIVRVKRR